MNSGPAIDLRRKTYIDGVEYTINPLPATLSWRTFLRLGKIIGPSIGMVLDSAIQTIMGDKEKEVTGQELLQHILDQDVNSKLISDLTTTFMDRATEGEVEAIIAVMRSVSFASNRSLEDQGYFDHHFAGKPWSMFKWLGWCIASQYGSFTTASGKGAAPDATSVGAGQPAQVQ